MKKKLMANDFLTIFIEIYEKTTLSPRTLRSGIYMYHEKNLTANHFLFHKNFDMIPKNRNQNIC